MCLKIELSGLGVGTVPGMLDLNVEVLSLIPDIAGAGMQLWLFLSHGNNMNL